MGQGEDPFVAADQVPADMLHHLRLLLLGVRIGGKAFGLEEKTVPVVELALGAVGAVPGEGAEKGGRFEAVGQGDELLALLPVRQEHGRRAPLPDLQGVDMKTPVVFVDIDEDLGGVPDSFYRLVGVPVAKDGEIGDCIEFEKVGACNPEKVPHHVVGGPGGEKVRKAIENQEGVLPFFGEDGVNAGGEGFEAEGWIEAVDGDRRRSADKGFMVPEAHINDPLSLLQGVVDERADEIAVIGDGIDLPDDIVPDAQVIEDLVQAGVAGRYANGGIHARAPFPRLKIKRYFCLFL